MTSHKLFYFIVQEGEDFFNYYKFYSGEDSKGSNGFINYVSREVAEELDIANVTFEHDTDYEESSHDDPSENPKEEPFIYMSSSPTAEGPRNSVRLEGLTRYNRGLFILDLRHMPAGCGTWPAFWLTDEDNWPVNGEIDIVEGVNTQSVAKVALHTTQTCSMKNIPLGVRTGVWDTAVGVPQKNGDLDMTMRDAYDCYVYDKHQWLNQGCVSVSTQEGTLGGPLNENGGGVFVLEWDPMNRFIKSWVFSPHGNTPENLRLAMETARNTNVTDRVRPDPTLWPLPYAYYPIGKSLLNNMVQIFETDIND